MGSLQAKGTGDVWAAASERRRTAESTDAFLRGLISGMRCGVLAVDRELSIVLCNQIAVDVLELDRQPECGETLREAMPEHRSIAQALEESFAMPSLPSRAELQIEGPRGSGKMIGFTLSLVRDEAGEPLGAAMFFKDLTRIGRHEEHDRLKDRLAALGEMAATMAHEVRNPLASIDVTCTLLRRKLGPQADGAEMLNKVASEVKRLDRTIRSSLEYVRPVSLDLRPADLSRLLCEAVEVARQRHGSTGAGDVPVTVRLERDLPPFLMDRERLRQVFENLVLNALEAVGTSGGEVRVTARREPAERTPSLVPYVPADHAAPDPLAQADEAVAITVQDNGPGVPENLRDRIFFPFFTTKKSGSGVGLATARKIIGGHRGWIDVDEPTEGGAVFTVRLPMVVESAED